MNELDDILSRGRKGSAFSNGTEFHEWEASWCDRCLRDAPFRRMGKGMGCQILAAALLGDVIPAEWMEQPEDRYPSDAYHCIQFKGPGEGGGEPKPKPEPPQDGLFDRPVRQTRMYVQPQETRAEVSA